MNATQTEKRFHVRPEDRRLFDRLLRSFVPPDAFDAHMHLYELDAIRREEAPNLDRLGPDVTTWQTYQDDTAAYMGDRVPTAGLVFGFPTAGGDTAACNAHVAGQVAGVAGARGLILIRPTDDPAHVEAEIQRAGWLGFKVYHVYANRPDTFQADNDQFLPEWAWEIAHRRGLAIMLHMVKSKALSDPHNARYVRAHCLRYGGAKLILAHAGRAFCARHTVDSLEALRGLDNVFFDTSAICEAAAFEAILRMFGPRRLFFGSDYPVSNFAARAVSAGDGFFWIFADNPAWKGWLHGEQTLIGIESLLALRQACRTCHLTDSDVEQVFGAAARQVLGITAPPDGSRGQADYEHAKRIMPGGTQLLSKRPELFAPGKWPPYFAEARGVEVIDTDGRRFLDMSITGIGACLLGYADPDVNDAVARRVMLGSTSTLNSGDEIEAAELLLELHPWAEQVRFGRGGGEAMAIAVRIVRAASGRDVIAFCGYHGWQDWYLAANLGGGDQLTGHLLPGLAPAGVPRGLTGTVLPFGYNKLDELEKIVREHGDKLAAVVMEPTRSVDPQPGFLEGVRSLAERCGAALVFDEITVGFRLCRGGAHLRYGVEPDVAVFGKALGNGVPVAAVIGRAGVMRAAQESFISSTMWTEGLGSAAAVATLRKFKRLDVPAHVARIGTRFRDGLTEAAQRAGVPLKLGSHPAITSVTFDHPDAAALLTLLTTRMLEQGILAGGGFYVCLAHEERHVDRYLAAAEPVFVEVAEAIRQGDAVQRVGGKVKHSGFARLT